MQKDDAAVGTWIVNKLQLHNFLTLEGTFVEELLVPVNTDSPPPGHGMHTTRGNICMLFLYCRFVPLDSCWYISHYRELYVIDPYHSNIPSQAQMELGKKILWGFQNALEYLRDFTISECIPYTLPLQHSADSELWAVCVHDDAHVSY